MANFEQLNISGVSHIHLDMEDGDLEAMVADPAGFIAAHDPGHVVPVLPQGVPVTYEIFTWSEKDDIESPNVCEGAGGINSDRACMCTPASIIASDAHFRIYSKSA